MSGCIDYVIREQVRRMANTAAALVSTAGKAASMDVAFRR